MSTLGDRIKQLRRQFNMSQSDLAKRVELSYAQIGRYETKGVQPPAETLKRLANIFNVSPDYLLYGTSEEKAKTKLSDIDLINQFKAIELMNEHDKQVVKTLIEAFITKKKLEELR